MSGVRCFWIEPTDNVQIYLRRYVRDNHDIGREACSVSGSCYHNASVRIEDRAAIECGECDYRPGHHYLGVQEHPREDPRWPKACACGRAFEDGDNWQVRQEQIYRRADIGELTTLADRMPGAIWDAWWMSDFYRGPDGLSLCVMLPGGCDWSIDGPSFSDGKINNPRGWSRTGAPPVITARPSILVPNKYHGFLTDGVLVPC